MELEQILNRLDKLDNIIDHKNSEFIKRASLGKTEDCFIDFMLNTQKEREEYTYLCIEYLKVAPYELSNFHEDYGDYFGIWEFIGMCNQGGFIDNDGFGNLCVGDKKTNLVILPSYVFHDNFDVSRFDGVIWYNK